MKNLSLLLFFVLFIEFFPMNCVKLATKIKSTISNLFYQFNFSKIMKELNKNNF